MAQETRAQLYAKILANLPDNTTEQITPATDREVENAEVESCYNLQDDDATSVTYAPGDGANWDDPDPTEVGGALDDLAGRVTTIEGEPNQTAVQTPYSPPPTSDWQPEGTPTEVGGALDILAARTGQNLSQDIAYVSNAGDDLTGVRGNSEKPFASFTAALNAVSSSNCIVKALGGTYTEDIILNAGTVKNKCALILEGVTINGRINISTTNTNISIFLNGSTITNSTSSATIIMSCNGGNNFIYGGTVINTNASGACLTGSNTGVKNVIGTKFESQLNCTVNCFTFNFVKCNFSSQSICIFRTNNSEFYDCNIVSATNNGFRSNTTSCKLYNCFIQGTNGVKGENNLIGYFNNCRIEGTSGRAAIIGTSSNELFFKDCDLIGSTDCVQYESNITRAATTNHVFQNCKLYAGGTGAIFLEPTYLGTDLGNTQVINCVYNKAFTPAVGPQKIFESNKIEITGLQEPLK
jgi:hypothetical protein